MICCAWSTVTVWLKITADHQTKHRLSISVILLLIASNFLEFLTLPLGVVGHEGSTILVILNGLRMLLPLHKETPHQAKPTRKDCDDCILYQQSLHT